MGSCEGFRVFGHIECARTTTGGRQIVLALNPSDEGIQQAWQELCTFCDQKTDEPSHSHSLKGILSLSQNQSQLTFTLTDCPTGPKATPARPETLQYEIDGKLYELPVKKDASKKTTKKKSSSKPASSAEKQESAKVQFASENDKECSTPSVPLQPSPVQDDRSNLEISLSLLQVRLMENSIIPEWIHSGPDTPTFLNNMKELAKLITAGSGMADGSSYRCSECGEGMTSYFAYIEHAFKHLGIRPYVCTLCQAAFASRAVMRHHLDMHGGKAPFECDYCGKKFRNSSHMKQHRMRHTGEKPHGCPHCDKTFAHKNVLKIHLQTHTGQKPCCCDLCGKLFREPHRLACHLATHDRSSKALECPTCGKTFKMKGMLKLHQAKRCPKGPPAEDSSAATSAQNDEEAPDPTEMETDVLPPDSSSSVTDFVTRGALDASNQQLLLDGQHEVTIIEAETLEDGTMVLPVNTYIVGDPGLSGLDAGAVFVQFSIHEPTDGSGEPFDDHNEAIDQHHPELGDP